MANIGNKFFIYIIVFIDSVYSLIQKLAFTIQTWVSLTTIYIWDSIIRFNYYALGKDDPKSIPL